MQSIILAAIAVASLALSASAQSLPNQSSFRAWNYKHSFRCTSQASFSSSSRQASSQKTPRQTPPVSVKARR